VLRTLVLRPTIMYGELDPWTTVEPLKVKGKVFPYS